MALVPQDSAMPAVTDPGDAGTIDDDGNNFGVCELVSAGLETRVLGTPTRVGQRLSIVMKEDGGDIVLTCASILNATGNNTVTFADESDVIDLLAVEKNTGGLVWRIVGNDGAALSTV